MLREQFGQLAQIHYAFPNAISEVSNLLDFSAARLLEDACPAPILTLQACSGVSRLNYVSDT